MPCTGSNIGAAGLKCLAKALTTCTKLEVLNLNGRQRGGGVVVWYMYRRSFVCLLT